MQFHVKGLLVFALFLATVFVAVDGRFGLVAPGAALLIEIALWLGLFAGPSGMRGDAIRPSKTP